MRSGSATLKDAMNEALRDWVGNVDSTFYIIGSVAGPHPTPRRVRDFQAVIGNEVRAQIMAKEGGCRMCWSPASLSAIGLFHPFLDEPEVRMIGVEAAGHGIESGEHAAALSAGQPGVLHGSRSYLLQDADGQVLEAHSISAGLDYPGVGPEHAWLKDTGRVEYVAITDDEALGAFRLCSELEGILPALEPAHALARGQDCADPAERPSDRHESVRPGRQGHLHRGGRHGGDALSERIERRFAELKEAGRGGLITFLCAGDPDPRRRPSWWRDCRQRAPI